MSLADWLFSWLLIIGHPMPDMATIQAAFPLLRGPMICLVIDAEIVDKRCLCFTLASRFDLMDDLETIRKSYQAMIPCPPVADSERFIARDKINEALVFNRAYRKYLETRQAGDVLNAHAIRIYMAEADRIYAIWDKARDAKCEYYYVQVRREALQKLREMLSPADYRAGRLPPYVPIWRFEGIP